MAAHTAEHLAGPSAADVDDGPLRGRAALWYDALGITPPGTLVRGLENEQNWEHPAPAESEQDPVTWASRDDLLVNILEHTHRTLRGRRSA